MIDVSNQNPLIRRAFMALEDGEWFAADKHCEEALNQEPENAYAYLGKLLAKLYCHNVRELLERETPLTGDPLFEKILRFGTQDLREKLNWIDQGISARIEEKSRVQAQEEEQQRIQEEEATEERKKNIKKIIPSKKQLMFVAACILSRCIVTLFFGYGIISFHDFVEGVITGVVILYCMVVYNIIKELRVKYNETYSYALIAGVLGILGIYPISYLHRFTCYNVYDFQENTFETYIALKTLKTLPASHHISTVFGLVVGHMMFGTVLYFGCMYAYKFLRSRNLDDLSVLKKGD